MESDRLTAHVLTKIKPKMSIDIFTCTFSMFSSCYTGLKLWGFFCPSSWTESDKPGNSWVVWIETHPWILPLLLKGKPDSVAQCDMCDMAACIFPGLSIIKGAVLPHWEWQLPNKTLPSHGSHQKISCHGVAGVSGLVVWNNWDNWDDFNKIDGGFLGGKILMQNSYL